MIKVLCARFTNRYGKEYVERLRNMVSRHLTIPYEFCCLTDDQHPIDGVRSIFLPNQNYSKQWWHKVHMFDPALGLDGRILYFDLDVVIINNIDKLVETTTDEFFGIRDFNRKFVPKWDKLNSSSMSWIAGTQNDIFRNFIKNKPLAMRLHGDQDWIYKCASDRIKYWPDEWIQSYKWEIRSKTELNYGSTKRLFKTVIDPKINKECSVCVFHGNPKPEDVQDPIIINNWK